jgi:hypothetical protein
MIRGRNSNFLLPDYLKAVYDELEREEKRRSEIQNGEFLKANGYKYPVIIGTEKKKKSQPFLDEIDDLNFNSVVLERELRKAIEEAKKLKTERVEVKKTVPKKPGANDVIRQILHGEVRGFEALKKVMVCGL